MVLGHGLHTGIPVGGASWLTGLVFNLIVVNSFLALYKFADLSFTIPASHECKSEPTCLNWVSKETQTASGSVSFQPPFLVIHLAVA